MDHGTTVIAANCLHLVVHVTTFVIIGQRLAIMALDTFSQLENPLRSVRSGFIRFRHQRSKLMIRSDFSQLTVSGIEKKIRMTTGKTSGIK